MTNVLKGKKVFVALLVVAAMVFSMGITVFAASPGDYEATLYKHDQFNPANPGSNLSMGNPAILGADISADNKTVTVYVQSMPFLGLTGYVSAMSLDGTTGVANPALPSQPSQFTFEFDDEIELDAVFDASLSIVVADPAHAMPVSATLVIFDN